MSRPIAVKKGIFADHTIVYILPHRNERINPRRHLAVHNAIELQGFFFLFKLFTFSAKCKQQKIKNYCLTNVQINPCIL